MRPQLFSHAHAFYNICKEFGHRMRATHSLILQMVMMVKKTTGNRRQMDEKIKIGASPLKYRGHAPLLGLMGTFRQFISSLFSRQNAKGKSYK